MKNSLKIYLAALKVFNYLVTFSQHRLKENYNIIEVNNSKIIDEYLSIT